MNTCIICGNIFEPPKSYKNKKTCCEKCLKIHLRNQVPDSFLDNSFKPGQKPFNKGKPQSEWLSAEDMEKCKEHYIQNQSCKSELSQIEGRYLPHNTLDKGTVTKRKHIHKTGKNKGKIDYEYYINIDWRGNRKPNNLYRRYVWEVNNQMDIPKGYVVYSIDGSIDNFDISNLTIITRKELLLINSGKYDKRGII